MMGDILQVTANGIIAGSLVALVAVSYSLVYSVLRFINFAFGEVLMMGAYSFYMLTVVLDLPPVLGATVGAVVVGLFGTMLQAGAYRPFYRRSRLASLITALGLSIVIQNLALLAFDGRPLSLSASADHVFRLGAVAITKAQIAVILAAFVILLTTDRIVFRTITGLRVRALADNLAMAELLGVSVDRTILFVFFLGSTLAAISGVFLSFEHLLKPTMGLSPGIQAFAACVVGGIGSIRGAVGAAFGIAVVSHFLTFALPLITPDTTSYAVLLLALGVFPLGLSQFFARLTGSRRLAETPNMLPPTGAPERGA